MQPNAAAPDKRAETLTALRARVARLERKRTETHGPLALGWPGPDAVLEGGLMPACLHEVTGEAAAGFALRLLGRLEGPVLWCHGAPARALLYAPGLLAFGAGLPDRLIVARARDPAEALWAAEEGLRAGALDAVVLDRAGRVDLTASRRLHLAAEAGGTLGLILGPGEGEAGARLAPSAAATRWRVDPAPGASCAMPGPDATPRWRLRLARRRGGGTGDWMVKAGPS